MSRMMEICNYTPELEEKATKAYNRLVRKVPYCYPVTSDVFRVEVSKPLPDGINDVPLEWQTERVVIEAGRVLGFIQLGATLPISSQLPLRIREIVPIRRIRCFRPAEPPTHSFPDPYTAKRTNAGLHSPIMLQLTGLIQEVCRSGHRVKTLAQCTRIGPQPNHKGWAEEVTWVVHSAHFCVVRYLSNKCAFPACWSS